MLGSWDLNNSRLTLSRRALFYGLISTELGTSPTAPRIAGTEESLTQSYAPGMTNDAPVTTRRKIQRVCWWGMLFAGGAAMVSGIATDNAVMAASFAVIAFGGLVLLMLDRRRLIP